MVGCSDDTTIPGKDLGGGKDRPSAKEAAVDASRDIAGKDLARSDSKANPDRFTGDYSPLCKDVASLRAEALSNGITVFKGVSYASAMSIKDLLDNIGNYTSTVVKIEGFITEICPIAGCYITLDDRSGRKMNLKVDDGTYDFRDTVKVGEWAIGEGIPSPTGDHGPQVYIQNHGAKIGNTICPLPYRAPHLD
jgi:hypothetical protein